MMGLRKQKKNSPTINETGLKEEEIGKPKSTKVEMTIKLHSMEIILQKSPYGM
jgi:hypothetical protein